MIECVPPCKTCTGLCKQTAPVRPNAPKPASTPKKSVEAGYIPMTCGHWTTREEQTLVQIRELGRPRKKSLWCEECGSWKARKAKSLSQIVNEEERRLF
jgi:hypothetical protein